MFMIANTKNMSIVQYTSADNTLMAAQKGCRYQRQFGVLISVLSAVISLWLLSFNMVDAALISKPPANLGLVGYWSMNENTGTVASDFSGNGNRGILTNGPTWVDGKRGKALNFDGVNDYVGIPDRDYLDLGTSNWSLALWVKTEQSDGGLFCHDSASAVGCGGDFYSLEIIGGNAVAKFDAGGLTARATSTTTVNDGKWHHLVLVRSAPKVVNIYVDGVFEDSYDYSGSGGTLVNPSRTLTIGALDGANFINGLIDEVRIYNRALSATEIQALYKSGAAK